MNRIPVFLMFLVLWLAVFGQTQFPVLHRWVGVPLGVLPALVVYVALTHGLALTAGFSVVAGLWLDSLSASRFGVSLLPLFGFAFVVQTRSHLLLREQRFAQCWLGLAGGFLVPLMTAGLLQLGQREPAFTPGTWWQLLVLGGFNGLACPLVFSLFDRLNHTFNYTVSEPQSFRADRQIVRGRT